MENREGDMGERRLTWHSKSSLEHPKKLLLCWLREQGVEAKLESTLRGHCKAVGMAEVKAELGD